MREQATDNARAARAMGLEVTPDLRLRAEVFLDLRNTTSDVIQFTRFRAV